MRAQRSASMRRGTFTAWCTAFAAMIGIGFFESSLAAALITFRFDTTLPATPGDEQPPEIPPGTPLSVTYTFDSELQNTYVPSGPTPQAAGNYGPLVSMRIQLGAEHIDSSGSGGFIMWHEPTYTSPDGYDVRPG